MRRIAVIASDRQELGGVLKRAGEGEPLHLPVRFSRRVVAEAPETEPTEWLLVADGIGAAAADRACAAIPDPDALDAVVSVGYCGATREGWKVGDVLAGRKVTHEATGEEFPCTIPAAGDAPLPEGVILSVDRVIRFAEEKQRIGERGVDAVEMEAAAVARFARRRGLPFLALKAVSDTCHEDLPIDFDRARRADGSVRIGSILAQTLSRPWTRIPSLSRLARSARLASASLGEAIVGMTW